MLVIRRNKLVPNKDKNRLLELQQLESRVSRLLKREKDVYMITFYSNALKGLAIKTQNLQTKIAKSTDM